MDTRTKILTPAAARNLKIPLTIVTGYFDVLRAEHVRELREAKENSALMALALPLNGALLEQRARAELAAALRVVDYVVAAEPGEAEPLIEALKPDRVVRLEVAEIRRSRQLREHVQRRQSR